MLYGGRAILHYADLPIMVWEGAGIVYYGVGAIMVDARAAILE
jgi:hypothetical protein